MLLMGLMAGTCTFAGIVQIRGLSDRLMAAKQVQTRSNDRVSDSFCVTSDARATVSLAFNSANGASGDGQSWVARNAAGTPFDYVQFVSNADSSGELQVSRPGQSIFVLPAGKSVSAAECGSGNVTKSVRPTHGAAPAGAGDFTDVVTVVVSPM